MPEAKEIVESTLREDREALLEEWVRLHTESPGFRSDLIGAGELRVESERLLDGITGAVAADSADADISGPEWSPVRDALTELSRTRATQGFSPTDTATFVYSLKQPLFQRLRGHAPDADALAEALWSATVLLDRLGLFTAEAYLRSREELIRRQQDELVELSTPVVELFDGVVALPLIGTLDSSAHPGRDGEPARDASSRPTRRSRSSTSPACRRSTRSSPSTCCKHGRGRPADGRRLHHQRHPAADRPDDRAPRPRPSEVVTKASLADALTVALDRHAASPVTRVGAGG